MLKQIPLGALQRLGVPFLGVLMRTALLPRVKITAPDFWKLPFEGLPRIRREPVLEVPVMWIIADLGSIVGPYGNFHFDEE